MVKVFEGMADEIDKAVGEYLEANPEMVVKRQKFLYMRGYDGPRLALSIIMIRKPVATP